MTDERVKVEISIPKALVSRVDKITRGYDESFEKFTITSLEYFADHCDEVEKGWQWIGKCLKEWEEEKLKKLPQKS